MATRMVNANRRRNRARAENRPERWPGDFEVIWDEYANLAGGPKSYRHPIPDARRKFFQGRAA
jgi:hypothetical protein